MDASTALQTTTWNSYWEGCCDGCGREFQVQLNLYTGHRRIGDFLAEANGASTSEHPFEKRRGLSEMIVRGDESIWMECDSWDHQKTIEIEIHRRFAGNSGQASHQLGTSEKIIMTVTECLELMRQLQGPFSPQLKRQPWWIDTT